jgi:CBS-domain-containing membrane protein
MVAPLLADETAGTVADTTPVSELLPIVVASERPIAVLDDEGRVAGAVDRLCVLRALADDTDPARIGNVPT